MMLRTFSRLTSRFRSYGFCSQAVGTNITGDNRAANFYRNSIRKININSKGRGKFTQHHLLRLTKLMESSEQQQLLLEAFYNYIGHFTLMDSTTVDKMMVKIMSFQGCNAEPLIKLIHDHVYLGYFPHFQITNQLLKMSTQDSNNHITIIRSLMVNPLIKFNAETIMILKQMLLNETTPHNVASTIVKLFAIRSKQGIIDDTISSDEVRQLLAQFYQNQIDRGSLSLDQKRNTFKEWVQAQATEGDKAKYEMAIICLGNRLTTQFAQLVDQIQDQAVLDRTVQAVTACPERYRQKLIQICLNLIRNQGMKNRLSGIQSTQQEASPTENQKIDEQNQAEK